MALDLGFGAAERRLLLGHLQLTGEFSRSVVGVVVDGIGSGELAPWVRRAGVPRGAAGL